jgi:uncharacterized repeat protein (TIGR01451 family)
MKSILLSFFKRKGFVVCFLCCVMLLTGQQTQAQIYSANTTTAYYDIATNTWTAKSGTIGADLAGSGQLPYNGAYLYGTVFGTGKVYRYDIAANTWASILTPPAGFTTAHGVNALIGNDLYELFYNGTGSNWVRLTGTAENAAVPTTNTYTTRLINPAVSRSPLQGAYNGTHIYGNVSTAQLYRYDPVANTWLTRAAAPAAIGEIVASQTTGMVYALKDGVANPVLYKYNPTTNTWSTLAGITSTATIYYMAIDQAASKIYLQANTTGAFWVYDIATNVWTAKATNPFSTSVGNMGVATMLPCTITATPTATQATCTAGVANADAKLDLTAHAGGGTKVGYSIGSSYTGAAFATATTLTAAPFSVATGLANPAINQPYTIRVYRDATCYKDFSLMLERKKCITADIAVTVASTPQTANQGETLTYTVTVTNNGPDTSPSVVVDVPIPANVTYLNGTASQGSYSTVTKKWTVGSMANAASNTLVLSLKVN